VDSNPTPSAIIIKKGLAGNGRAFFAPRSRPGVPQEVRGAYSLEKTSKCGVRLITIPVRHPEDVIMAKAVQLKALLKSHIEGDDAHFSAVAMQMAASEARRGHGKLAQEIRALIDEAKAKKSAPVSLQPIPIAIPRGELSTLLSVSYPKLRLADMVLPESVSEHLKRLIKEQRQIKKIRSCGLMTRKKLLLVGQPGTGKTMSATALAGELGLPLFTHKGCDCSRPRGSFHGGPLKTTPGTSIHPQKQDFPA